MHYKSLSVIALFFSLRSNDAPNFCKCINSSTSFNNVFFMECFVFHLRSFFFLIFSSITIIY
uniref:Secreted protein n=1 Tax=Ascaris lumbricoides TaxID=6252 RepID=A0A0M3IST4_ASCLU